MELVAIGKVLKPFGIHGLFKVLPLTDFPERFQKLQSVWIGQSEKDAAEQKVVEVHLQSNGIFLKIENINSIEEVEAVRNYFVFIPKTERIALSNGRYYIDTIIGCSVYNEEQSYIGVVKDVISIPAHDIWIVQYGAKEILIPAVKVFIKSVDTENKKIIINVVEGLLD